MGIYEDDIPVANETQRKIFQLGFDYAYDALYDNVKEYLNDIGPEGFWNAYDGWEWNHVIPDVVIKAHDWKRAQL